MIGLRAEGPRFDSRQGQGRESVSLFATASRAALHPNQICFLPRGAKRPEREADHSPPFSAEVRHAWSFTSTPLNIFISWYLIYLSVYISHVCDTA